MVDEETEIESAFHRGNGSTLNTGDNESRTSDLRPRVTFREKAIRVLHSHKFQLCVIALVIVDCLLVITDLLLEAHPEYHDARHIPHYLSIAVLSIFLIELAVKLYAMRLEFFQHKLEIFDAIIIILSFTLDIVFLDASIVARSGASATGLLIVLRLWRVARVLNGVVLSVKTQAEHKLSKERKLREALEQEVFHLKDCIMQLEQRNNLLSKKLKEHGIHVPGIDETTATTFGQV